MPGKGVFLVCVFIARYIMKKIIFNTEPDIYMAYIVGIGYNLYKNKMYIVQNTHIKERKYSKKTENIVIAYIIYCNSMMKICILYKTDIYDIYLPYKKQTGSQN